VIVAGCSTPGNGTPAPTSGPDGSASAACPAAPAIGDAEVQAWLHDTPTAPIVPVIATSQLVCGANRILLGLLDSQNRSVASPDYTVAATFYSLGRDRATPVASADGKFVWAIEGTRGLYVFNTTFPESGIWGADLLVSLSGVQYRIRVGFEVHPTGITKRVGEAAPASKTPTAADVGGDLSMLSTDQDPEPRFYETSVDDALAADDPFLLIFATPKFCTSAVCGPTLDKVKPFVAEFPSITFINVEPYELAWDGSQLQPVLTDGALTPVPAVNDFGLLAEPWVFVVDDGGTIQGSFEGIVGAEELRAALQAVS
jgi:hypothetical protein